MKRPQMKTPEVKAPAMLSDLYYDLRDRRLLPLIGLLAVAIVATPFLLGQDSETTPPPQTPAAIQVLKEGGGRATASLTVVQANPGLRDYRRRLRNRTPLDPFREPPKPSLKKAQLRKGSSGEGSSSAASFSSTSKTTEKTTTEEGSKTTTKTTETTTTTTGKGSEGDSAGKGSKGSEGPAGDGGSTAGGGSGGKKTTIYKIDVQISTPGSGSADPVERRNVAPATPLPGKKTPVVTYLGAGSGASRALFSVSKAVSAVYGEAKCVSGTDTCEVLELEPNFPVTFVYGPDQVRYKVKLLKIEPAG